MKTDADIEVIGGTGGNGAVSFRREKFVPSGGPDGGEGGEGGNVFLVASHSVDDLSFYSSRKTYTGERGKHGSRKNQKGKNGKDLFLKVPVGTQVRSRNRTGPTIPTFSFTAPGQTLLIAKGGAGGRGNAAFVTPSNQAPLLREQGQSRKPLSLGLEVLLLADVGLVGKPNAGKSSLLALITRARPKIAAYPFTTIEPTVGVLERGATRCSVMEIPGLIKDAHSGRGLGLDFLRHASFVEFIVHLVDGGSLTPMEDYLQVREEISKFDATLASKREIVAINKMDTIDDMDAIQTIAAELSLRGLDVYFISATTGLGVDQLVAGLFELIPTSLTAPGNNEGVIETWQGLPSAAVEDDVVRTEEGAFVVRNDVAERLVSLADLSNPLVLAQAMAEFKRMGIMKHLEALEVPEGTRVIIGSTGFTWKG